MSSGRDTPAQVIGRRLRVARVRINKISQDEIAKRLMVDRSTVSKHERGDAIPNAVQLAAYVDAYKVRADWLLFGGGESREQQQDEHWRELESIARKIYRLSPRERASIMAVIVAAFRLLESKQ